MSCDDARDLPPGRHQAGDRHSKIHAQGDNLDPDTGNLYVGPKTPGPNSEYQPTGIRIKDGNVEYGVSEPPIEPSAPDIPEIPDIFGE
jgi:hypothetical protein